MCTLWTSAAFQNTSGRARPGIEPGTFRWLVERSSTVLYGLGTKVEFRNTLANQWGLPWVTHPKVEFQRSRAQVAKWLDGRTLNQLVVGSIPRIHIIFEGQRIKVPE